MSGQQHIITFKLNIIELNGVADFADSPQEMKPYNFVPDICHWSIKWSPEKGPSARLIWGDLLFQMGRRDKAYRPDIFAFVIMPDHLHALIRSTPQHSFVSIIDSIIFSSMHDHCDPAFSMAIRSYPQFLQVYKYILRNPVTAGFVRRVEEYPFSSLQILSGKESHSVVIADPFNFITDGIRILSWLNSPDRFSPYFSMAR